VSELDVIKEHIGYLKVWLGIMVVTDIILFGWLTTNFQVASPRIISACIFAIVCVSSVILLFHKRIERHIQNLRRL